MKRELTELSNAENIQENIDAKKVANYGYDLSGGQWRRLAVDVNGNLGFSPTSTIISTSGSVKTITETDGVRTRTTIIDSTDASNKTITESWS